jgi:hypothetical protein
MPSVPRSVVICHDVGMRTFKLADADLPDPGETVEVDLGDGFVASIENTNAPSHDDATDPPVMYSAVETVVPRPLLTPAVRQRAQRTRVDRYTLCSRNESRPVKRRKRDLPLTAVTCVQCRKRLENEGVL